MYSLEVKAMTGDSNMYGCRGYKEQNCCFLCDWSRGIDPPDIDTIFCSKFEFCGEGHFICDDFDVSKEYHGN